MENLNKELPKALTIEDLKNKVNKPVFIRCLENFNYGGWNVLQEIGYDTQPDKIIFEYVQFIDYQIISSKDMEKYMFFDKEVSNEELEKLILPKEKSFNIKEILLTDEELKLVSYVLDKQVDLCYAWSRIHSLDKNFYNNLKSANEKINKYLKGE